MGNAQHMYDIIGDIHGHADELKALLGKLGYTKSADSYQQEDRKIIFVGDYIDRGPKIRETLEIVKGMVDAGNAIALMGNHEYNTICYHTKDSNGKPLREHSEKNVDQHKETVEQFAGREAELQSYVQWFMTLPLFHETEQLRVVHACWDFESIDVLTEALGGNRLNDRALQDAHNGNTQLFNALEITLKGKELSLPVGYSFTDKQGHKRKEIRVRWWLECQGRTYKNYSVIYDANLPDNILDDNFPHTPYREVELPVFFGHYWLKPTRKPTLFRSNICCLDYSVAKEGYLMAYRYQGEESLDDQRFLCHDENADQIENHSTEKHVSKMD